MFEYTVLLRKSLGSVFDKLNDTLKTELAKSVKVQIEKAVTDGVKDITIKMPDAVFKRIEKKLDTLNKKDIKIPATFKLSEEDIDELRPESVEIPDTISLDDKTIAKIEELIPTINLSKTIAVSFAAALEMMKKNPKLFLNVRLTNGQSFYNAIDKLVAVASGNGVAIPASGGCSLTDTELRATPVEVTQMNALVPDEYDYIALTYVATGNGEGEVETVTYKTGGSGGTTVATLTLTYNSDNEISSVTKT